MKYSMIKLEMCKLIAREKNMETKHKSLLLKQFWTVLFLISLS